MRFSIFCFTLIIFFQSTTQAHLGHRPDGHGPIGVMADHTHKKGEVMFSYRLMHMTMQGLQQGTRGVSPEQVFSNSMFMMVPEDMEMWMHMIGAMYGVSDRFTVATMIPYTSNSMSMKTRTSGRVDSESNGLGDISLTGLYSINEDDNSRFLVSLGLSLPTGSVEADKNGNRLGYPMQLGSGSYAAKPQVTYSHYWSSYSLNIQTHLKHFLHENKAGYTRGTEYGASVWGAYKFCESLSSSLRLEYLGRDPIQNADAKINAMMSPTNRPDMQNGQWVNTHLGVNWIGQEWAKGHRLAFEIGTPIYQNLHGTQMKNTLIGTFGWQKAF